MSIWEKSVIPLPVWLQRRMVCKLIIIIMTVRGRGFFSQRNLRKDVGTKELNSLKLFGEIFSNAFGSKGLLEI